MLHGFARRLRGVQEVPRDERGFTLIELLVVIIIIGILAAIAIPAFLSQRNRAEQEAARANVRNAATAQQAAYAEVGNYVSVTPLAGAQDDITDFGFNQGDLQITGNGAGNAFCVEAAGGNETYHQTQDDGSPQPGGCPAA